MYSIYGIFNTINNKLYIGLTNNLKRRWQEHKKCSKKITSRSYAVHYAIYKYGVENFIVKEIDIAIDLNSANLLEMMWIKELKSMGHQLYNETPGGDGVKGYHRKWTEEQKQAASIKNSGSKNPMYGVQLFGSDNGNFGKTMKPHVKEILLKCRRKLSDEQITEIRQLYSTGNYTQTALSIQFNCNLTTIHDIVHNRNWSDNPNTELLTKKNITIEDARKIKELYATNNYSQEELGKQFGISGTQVGRIINGQRWKNA